MTCCKSSLDGCVYVVCYVCLMCYVMCYVMYYVMCYVMCYVMRCVMCCMMCYVMYICCDMMWDIVCGVMWCDVLCDALVFLCHVRVLYLLYVWHCVSVNCIWSNFTVFYTGSTVASLPQQALIGTTTQYWMLSKQTPHITPTIHPRNTPYNTPHTRQHTSNNTPYHHNTTHHTYQSVPQPDSQSLPNSLTVPPHLKAQVHKLSLHPKSDTTYTTLLFAWDQYTLEVCTAHFRQYAHVLRQKDQKLHPLRRSKNHNIVCIGTRRQYMLPEVENRMK